MKSQKNRRDFLTKSSAIGLSALSLPLASFANNEFSTEPVVHSESKLIIPKGNALPITGTFLDEISHDIPHQNWGEKEWDKDFAFMKAVGIDTVIMIRSGYRRFITYPSEYLIKKRSCYIPSIDLVDLFLRLADKHKMKFYFGLYLSLIHISEPTRPY